MFNVNVVPRLINLNSYPSDSDTVVHYLTKSVGIVYDLLLDGERIPVNHQLQQAWNVSDEELRTAAIKNASKLYSVRIESLSGRIESLSRNQDNVNETEVTGPMVIFWEPMRMSYGAAAILLPETQLRLWEMFPHGFLLLPCSIHEWIAVTSNELTEEELEYQQGMVRDVNKNVVIPVDRLSDEIFTLTPDGQMIEVHSVKDVEPIMD